MKVLVACESSGRVRDAFLKLGHEAYSCDLYETSWPGPHLVGDVLQFLDYGWDLMIAHPPCTRLSVCGAKHFKVGDNLQFQLEAIDFFMKLMRAPIPRICLENPIGIMSTVFRPPNQIVQPYWFGDNESKSTCLWLKNLPKLIPTNIVERESFITMPSGKRMSESHFTSAHKGRFRSVTYWGIARAMAAQWGILQPLQK